MFNKKSVVLYCGGAPSMAPATPVSPGAGGGGSSSSGAPAAAAVFTANGRSEGAGPFSPRIGRGWGASVFPEGPLARIGSGAPLAGPLARIGPFEVAPRALIGSPAAAAVGGAARPLALPLPEGELDGCDDEAEAAAEAGDLPSPTPSLESIPSAQGDDDDAAVAAAPAPDDLRKVTLELVSRYLREAASGDGDAKGPSGGGGKKMLKGLLGRLATTEEEEAVASPGAAQALETLRRVGDNILDKHQLAFQGMLRKIEIKKEDDLKTVSEVAKHLFSDGITNWGRIVTLISFGAFVAKHLKRINQESAIGRLAELITEVLVTDKREWILNNNAWEGFVNFFHVEDVEGSIRSVLMAFAGVAGIGAGLAYMIR
ncbi:induced myeloid leukemia cell differentiation protein Mcl-1 [Podarcis raffonei]|uniref:induced myeloid leukemia cell differentiation protein Mcl-1 n=1 Tax=Podarcis raffonei TaxID=65483 RepID=UPI00232912CE|nr:induced myeloid leukemia cell differentiation protein Mcl-1 [Podarcis raffonei]